MNFKTKKIPWFEGCGIKEISYISDNDAWYFGFSNGINLRIDSCWRITDKKRILLGSCDHLQKFGLPQPIDGSTKATALLSKLAVRSAHIREISGDLVIYFTQSVCLEVLNNSSGYDSWQLNGPKGQEIIAQGGGHICFLNK